jgi:hypothetical protein
MRTTGRMGVRRFGPESVSGISGNVFAFAMTLFILNVAVTKVLETAGDAVLARALAAL